MAYLQTNIKDDVLLPGFPFEMLIISNSTNLVSYKLFLIFVYYELFFIAIYEER